MADLSGHFHFQVLGKPYLEIIALRYNINDVPMEFTHSLKVSCSCNRTFQNSACSVIPCTSCVICISNQPEYHVDYDRHEKTVNYVINNVNLKVLSKETIITIFRSINTIKKE